MANRFNSQIYPSQYQREPLDQILQIGMLKDKAFQDEHDKIQNEIDTNANYQTAYIKDTNTKLALNKKLQEDLGTIKGDLTDPLIQNQIHKTISDYINNPDVNAAIERTTSYKYLQDQKEKLGKDFRPSNVLGANGENYYNLIDKFEAGDKQAGEALRKAPTITPYFDKDKEMSDQFQKVHDSGSVTPWTDKNGNKYFLTLSGKSADQALSFANYFLANNKDAQNQMRLDMIANGENPDESLKDYFKQLDPKQANELRKLGINENNSHFDLEQKVQAIQWANSHNGMEQKISDDGYGLIDHKNALEQPSTNTQPEYTPAKTYPSENISWHIDSNGKLHSEFGTFDERNIENKLADNDAERNPIIKYVPFAKFFDSLFYKLAIGDTPDEKTMDNNEKRQYQDIRNIVVNKMKVDNPGAPLTEKAINLGMKSYMEMSDNMNNPNLLMNAYTDQKTIKAKTDYYFVPGKDGKISLQGNYINRKFYNTMDGKLTDVKSGSQWIKDASSKDVQPVVMGEFTPDNPYTSYGMPVQTGNGQISFMEGNPKETGEIQNRFAHDIYLSKYNNKTNANYFNYGKTDFSSHYNPKDNSYTVESTENGKKANYVIGGNNPSVETLSDGSKITLTSPEVFYYYLSK